MAKLNNIWQEPLLVYDQNFNTFHVFWMSLFHNLNLRDTKEEEGRIYASFRSKTLMKHTKRKQIKVQLFVLNILILLRIIL